MIQKPTEQLLQTLIQTLSEVSKRLVRTEAKVTQLMMHAGMKSDGRQSLQPRANHGA